MLLPHECSKLMEPLHQDWVEELLLSWICQQLQDYQQQYLHPGINIRLCYKGDLWGAFGEPYGGPLGGPLGGFWWGLWRAFCEALGGFWGCFGAPLGSFGGDFRGKLKEF